VSIYIFYTLGSEYSFKEGFQLNKVLFAVLVILYPLFDLLRVFILRIKGGQSPFVADNRHIHHFLINKFNSHFKVTFTIVILEILITSFCVFIY